MQVDVIHQVCLTQQCSPISSSAPRTTAQTSRSSTGFLKDCTVTHSPLKCRTAQILNVILYSIRFLFYCKGHYVHWLHQLSCQIVTKSNSSFSKLKPRRLLSILISHVFLTSFNLSDVQPSISCFCYLFFSFLYYFLLLCPFLSLILSSSQAMCFLKRKQK